MGISGDNSEGAGDKSEVTRTDVLSVDDVFSPIPSSKNVTRDSNYISPFVFLPAAKGRGRPKKIKRAGKPWLKNTAPTEDQPKKGKKRKSNFDTDGVCAKVLKPTEEVANLLNGKKRRGRPPKSCNICKFNFDDPVKSGKKLMTCTNCQSPVHEACFRKDRLEVGLEGCNYCKP